MIRLLTIGHCCVDDVFHVLRYPAEDSTVGTRTKSNRCIDQNWARGGNASNNATVLALLGADVEFFGTLAGDHLKQFFLDDMDSYGIKYTNCPILESYKAGISSVICSLETGSRTIIHCSGSLPELTSEQFESHINVDNYSWIHFEGRNEVQVLKMVAQIQEYNKRFVPTLGYEEETESENIPSYKRKKVPVSIEIEKQIETISVLLPYADVVFIGKEYACMKGAKDPISAAELFSEQLPKGALVVCPWGEQGAAFTISGDSFDKIKKVESFPPEKIVDSLGAGDTFNAAVIYALSNNFPIEASIRFECKIAGAKLGFRGFRQIAQLPKDI